MTVQSYSSQGMDEVSFDKGVTVEVIQKNLEGWWYIRWVNFSSEPPLNTHSDAESGLKSFTASPRRARRVFITPVNRRVSVRKRSLVQSRTSDPIEMI